MKTVTIELNERTGVVLAVQGDDLCASGRVFGEAKRFAELVREDIERMVEARAEVRQSGAVATEPRPPLDMDRIVELLEARGVVAFVQQTGGGCATIMAGESYLDAAGDDRYPALAGPGWFDGPNWTKGRCDPTDFYIGPDDDGDTPIADMSPVLTEENAVERIAAVVAAHEKGRP